MTIKQKMLLSKTTQGLHLIDTLEIDKRTLKSVLYHEWLYLNDKDEIKLTIEGIEALNQANHLSIYIKHQTPLKGAKIIQMRKRA